MLSSLFTSADFQTYIWIALGALLMSIILSKGVLYFFPKWNLLDTPEKYGHKRAPIPYPGGIAIVITFIIMLLLLFPVNLQSIGFLLGILLISSISFCDDRFGVHPVLRLGIQVLIGGILVITGTKIVYISNPFGPMAFELTPLLSTLMTIGWTIALINTVNWLDGVPGVAAGTSTIVGIFLGILSLTPIVDQPELAVMCFIFSAANAGFFLFNIPPPKMLNGDTGAMFSGLVIAVFSIFSGGKIATAFLVLALPIFDAFCVIFHRLRKGSSPWKGQDKRHLHDQLIARGFSKQKIMWIFLAVSAVLGFSALYLQTLGKISLLALLGITIFVISWKNQK